MACIQQKLITVEQGGGELRMWIELHSIDGKPRLFNTDQVSTILTDSYGVTEVWIGSNYFEAKESVEEIKTRILAGERAK
jgi:hypothetical protein